MIIRKTTINDINRLYEIEKSSFDINKYHILKKRQIKYLITKANSEVWLAEVNNNVCGYIVVLFKKNSLIGRLYSIAVAPPFQGGDVGKILFIFAEKLVKEKSKKFISQEIRKDNFKLFNRYMSLGYRNIGVLKEYYPDNGDGIKLIKELL